MSSLKLIIMGSGGVGKSAITQRYCSAEFVEEVSFFWYIYII